MRPIAFPGGVAAPDLSQAYVAGNLGTIDALRLDDGAVAWSKSIRGLPVLATEEAVYVRTPEREAADGIAFVVLDAATGGERVSLTIELPAEIARLRGSGDFELEPAVRGDELVLDWRSLRAYKGGAPPPAALEESFEEEYRGRLVFDLVSGEAATGEGATDEAVGDGPERLGLPRAASLADLLPSHAYRQQGEWQDTSWKVEGGSARLELDDSRTPPVLTLEVTVGDARAAPAATPLAESAAVEPVVTPDGRYLLVRETVPPGRPWRIFEVARGAAVAELPYREGSQLPCIFGGRAYFLELEDTSDGPRTRVSAIDLETAETLWRYDLGALEPEAPPELRQKGLPGPPGAARS